MTSQILLSPGMFFPRAFVVHDCPDPLAKRAHIFLFVETVINHNKATGLHFHGIDSVVHVQGCWGSRHIRVLPRPVARVWQLITLLVMSQRREDDRIQASICIPRACKRTKFHVISITEGEKSRSYVFKTLSFRTSFSIFFCSFFSFHREISECSQLSS